ncbi:hypothetical protein GEMRC1_006043 [Eukaryota sp. GEM-RC1]
MSSLTFILFTICCTFFLSAVSFSLRIFHVPLSHSLVLVLLMAFLCPSEQDITKKKPSLATVKLSFLIFLAVSTFFSSLASFGVFPVLVTLSTTLSSSQFLNTTTSHSKPIRLSLVINFLWFLFGVYLSIPSSVSNFLTLFPVLLFLSLHYLLHLVTSCDHSLKSDLFSTSSISLYSIIFTAIPFLIFEVSSFTEPPGRINAGITCGWLLSLVSLSTMSGLGLSLGTRSITVTFRKGFESIGNCVCCCIVLSWFVHFLKIDGHRLPPFHFSLVILSLVQVSFWFLFSPPPKTSQEIMNSPVLVNPGQWQLQSLITLIMLIGVSFLFVFPGKTHNVVPSSQTWSHSLSFSPSSSLEGINWPLFTTPPLSSHQCGLFPTSISTILSPSTPSGLSKLVNKSHLYLTLITTNDFIPIAEVWAYSVLKTNTNASIGVLAYKHLDDKLLEGLRCMGVSIFKISKTRCPESFTSSRYCSAGLFSKLYVWNMTNYSSILFLDADIVLTQNVDELFFLPGDVGVAINHPDNVDDLNGGFFLAKPSHAVFQQLYDAFLVDSSIYPHYLPVNSFFGHYFFNSATRLPSMYMGQGHRLFCGRGRRF